MIWSLKFYYLNFFLFLCVVVYLYRKHGRLAIHARSVQVRDALARATSSLSQAQTGLENIRGRFEGISSEQEELIRRIEAESRENAESILSRAAYACERVVEETQLQIEREVELAFAEVRREVVRRATELARQKLQAGLPSAEEQRLRREALRLLCREETGGERNGPW